MSNRRKRQARRRVLTPTERWRQDRYRPHRQYTPSQVRQILVEDTSARLDVPLSWYVEGCKYIAAHERKHIETVHTEIREACMERTGMDLPITGTL